MTKANQKIREEARRRGVFLWEVAAGLGMPESTFMKKLRFEFPEEEQARILSVIAEIAAGR